VITAGTALDSRRAAFLDYEHGAMAHADGEASGGE
jgi:hypothetical protein